MQSGLSGGITYDLYIYQRMGAATQVRQAGGAVLDPLLCKPGLGSLERQPDLTAGNQFASSDQFKCRAAVSGHFQDECRLDTADKLGSGYRRRKILGSGRERLADQFESSGQSQYATIYPAKYFFAASVTE